MRMGSWLYLRRRRALVLSASLLLAACIAEPDEVARPRPSHHPSATEPLPDDAMVSAHARPALCDRPGDDAVRDVFCADEPAKIENLADLQRALKLKFGPDGTAADHGNSSQLGSFQPRNSYATVSFLTHSTALPAELVSPINPRAVVMTYSTFLAFTRGVQQAEMAARDRASQCVNLYLLSFRQACNTAAKGCKPGDLYTPSIESDWTAIALQDDEDLKNTPLDCRQCHQRGSDQPMLLMRELDGPWTHFLSPAPNPKVNFPEPLGDDLLNDYTAAKGDETYASTSSELVGRSLGIYLQGMVPADQPLVFDGSTIMNERWPWTPDGYASEPARSATWDAAYAGFKRGELLPLPFYAPLATDPQKAAQLTAAYAAYRQGQLSAEDLPELADIFPDDGETRAEIGLQTEPDAAPADLLIQACGTCHNDVLDQSISRARFNIALGRLPRTELALAVARLKTDRAARGAMPPRGRRQLDADGLARLIDYLERTERPAEDADLLERASQLGMAGKQRRYDSPPLGH
jgi:cytochrome c553